MTSSVPTRGLPTAAAPPSAGAGSARRLLRAALRTRRRDLATASVLYSTHQLGEAMVPVIIGVTVSRAVDHGTWASIATWLVVLAADFTFLSMSYRFGARASMRAKQHTGHQVRMWLTGRVVGPAGGVHYPPGDLLSRASSDATRVGAYAGMLATAVAAAAVLIVSTGLLLYYSLVLGVIIVAGTAILLAVQNAAARLLLRRSAVEQYQRARATVLAEDLIRGLRVLRGVGAQRNAAAAYRQASQAAVRASVHAVSAQATLASVGAVCTGLYLVIIAGVGGWLALDGQLDLGQLVAALGLAQFLIGPMQVISGASAAYARALASAERIREVLLADPAVGDLTAGTAGEPAGAASREAAGPGGLEFADVALGALPAGNAADQGTCGRFILNARIPPGTMTAIVCGDPVIAAFVPPLLARESDPARGTIALDGTPVTALPLDTLRARVLVSYHDAALLPGSIADNLTALAVDAATAATAAHAAFADQVVAAVPDGGQTLVGDRGETLSGGQRQRVALARALAASPPVLVLHDPTTAVDAATEDAIAERVAALRAGRTTVLVTTSPAWLARSDGVVFLAPDRCATGTHASLRSDPAYREAVTR